MPVSGLSLPKASQVLLLCFWGALSYHIRDPAILLETSHGKAMWRGRGSAVTQREGIPVILTSQLSSAFQPTPPRPKTSEGSRIFHPISTEHRQPTES